MEAISFEDLSEAVKTHLLPILDRALYVCADCHLMADGEGANNFSFGTAAWSFPAQRFRDLIKAGEIPFQVASEPGCTLLFGQYRINHHRVGRAAGDDIRTSFPNNAQSASKSAGLQLSFDLGDEPYLSSPQTIVLAYMANPFEGMCAAYLATVKRVENGKIVEWDQIKRLYLNNQTPPPSHEAEPNWTPAETAPTPVVRLNRNKKRHES